MVPGSKSLSVPPKKKRSTGAIVGIVAGALAPVVGVVLLIVLLSKDKDTDKDRADSREQVAEQAFQTRKTADYLKGYALMTPADQDLLSKRLGIFKEQYEQQPAEISKQAQEEMKNHSEDAAYFGSSQYAIKSSRSLSKSELEEVNDQFASVFGYEEYVPKAVLAVITCSYTYIGSRFKEESPSLFVKENGKWYLSFNTASYSFMQNQY